MNIVLKIFLILASMILLLIFSFSGFNDHPSEVYQINTKKYSISDVVNSSDTGKTEQYYLNACEDPDWPNGPNPCERKTFFSRTELKLAYDEYYEIKGQEWMEEEKNEMEMAIKEGELTVWLGNAQPSSKEIRENVNVYNYYMLNHQVQEVPWKWYKVNDEFFPVITTNYVSPGAILILSFGLGIGCLIFPTLNKKTGWKNFVNIKRFSLGLLSLAIGFLIFASTYFISILIVLARDGSDYSGNILSLFLFFLVFGSPLAAVIGIPFIIQGISKKFNCSYVIATIFGLFLIYSIIGYWFVGTFVLR